MTTNNTTKSKKCSFCQSVGHNIRGCEDERILTIWEQMYFMGNIITPITGMANWRDIHRLLEDTPWNVTVAVAIKYCSAKIADKNNKEKILDLIYDSLWRHWSNYWWTRELQDLFDKEVEMLKPKNQWTISTALLCVETEAELKDPVDCPICLETYQKIQSISTNCNHTFCKDCMCSHIDHATQKPSCPMCRTDITSMEIKDVEIFHEINKKYSERQIPKDELRDTWVRALIHHGHITTD